MNERLLFGLGLAALVCVAGSSPLGAAPELRDCTQIPGAPGERPQTSHHHPSWRTPCQLEFPCPESGTCRYRIPAECGSVDGLECGEMPNRVDFGLCLGAKALCERTGALEGGAAGAERDYVSEYDFQQAALRDLPFDFACSGLGPDGFFEWCRYAEAMFPRASFLEALQWSGSWNFEPLSADKRVRCRLDGGRLAGGGIACISGDESGRGFQLGVDVAFSDVDGDGYLDAVMPLADAGVVRTVMLTRKDAASPFTHVGSRGPGFDCTAAETPVEERICDEPSLAALDEQTGKLFDVLVDKLEPADAERIRSEQRAFLKKRDQDCADGAPLDCLTTRYEARVEALRIEAWHQRCDLFDAEPCSKSQPLPRRE